MHRYRLYGVFIDAPIAQAEPAIDFWSAALGATPVADEDGTYHRLDGAVPGVEVEVQSVDDAPRYHLDIESDDVAAETARLVSLGAEMVAAHARWNVLRAPGGHLVCVVPVQSDTAFFTANSKVID